MDLILHTIGGGIVFLGLFVVLSGSFGLLRFPSFFARLHPAGVTDSFGTPLVLIGLMFIDGFTLISLKLAALLVLLQFTAPTACHALAKAAFYAAKQQNKP